MFDQFVKLNRSSRHAHPPNKVDPIRNSSQPAYRAFRTPSWPLAAPAAAPTTNGSHSAALRNSPGPTASTISPVSPDPTGPPIRPTTDPNPALPAPNPVPHPTYPCSPTLAGRRCSSRLSRKTNSHKHSRACSVHRDKTSSAATTSPTASKCPKRPLLRKTPPDRLKDRTRTAPPPTRPDFAGDLPPNRQELTNTSPNRAEFTGRPPGGDRFAASPVQRPDFGQRFPLTSQDITNFNQPRNPFGGGQMPFPLPGGSRQQDRPSLSADFSPPNSAGFTQPQFSQDRLQQIARERIQQMSRFGNQNVNDQFNAGLLGFGQDRFSSDQPPLDRAQSNPSQAGIIRPSERMNGGQVAFFDSRNAAGGPDQAPEFPNFQQRQQLNPFSPSFAADSDVNTAPLQFTFTTRGPGMGGPRDRDPRTSSTVPFWMQGSSNQQSVIPLNVFRTDIQRAGTSGAGLMVPQTRVLQNQHTSGGDGVRGATVPGSEEPVTEAPVRVTVGQIPHAASVGTATTTKLPWWLAETLPNGSSVTPAGSVLQQPLPVSPSASQKSLARNAIDYENVGKPAEGCDARVRGSCKLPDCWCGGTEIPGGLPVGETPQMIMITFDDAVTNQNYHLYTSIFNDGARRNPNGCPVRGTFYVSHEWSEYFLVQNLYGDGHEIGSHSISHTLPGKNFTKDDWADEIAGQREILQRFANVKQADVRGMRAPYLQTGGNSQFEMLWEKGRCLVMNLSPWSFRFGFFYKIHRFGHSHSHSHSQMSIFVLDQILDLTFWTERGFYRILIRQLHERRGKQPTHVAVHIGPRPAAQVLDPSLPHQILSGPVGSAAGALGRPPRIPVCHGGR